MSKRSIIRCILSLLILGYLAVALHYTSKAAASDTYKGLAINVAKTGMPGFITAEDIDCCLDTLSQYIQTLRRDTLNTAKIEQLLLKLDKIEAANCVILNDGTLRIDAVPLIPVARVFDGDSNYYINRAGKHMSSGPQYRVDVPVIIGKFNNNMPPTYALPLLDHINADKELSAMISAIDIKGRNDIMLVPAITGQIINFGDTSDIENKFRRLKIFYRDVLSVKGWELYDTISVKWRGQVVAKRRTARQMSPPVLVEEYTDIDSLSTVATDQKQIAASN